MLKCWRKASASDTLSILSKGLSWPEIAQVSCQEKEDEEEEAARGNGIKEVFTEKCADKWQTEVLHLAGAHR